MIVAGFDIATVSGVAVFDGDNLLRCASFRAKGDTEAEIFHLFRGWFRNLVRHYCVDHIAIEAPLAASYGATMYRTLLRLYGLRAVAMQSAHGLGIAITEVHQATWRKSFTGNGRATKDQTLELARQWAPDLKSKDAAEAIGIARHMVKILNEVGEAVIA